MKNIPTYFNIIPIQNKKPLVKWQDFTEREQTAEEKAELMKLNPNGKVGIVCGAVSRIIVLDIDGPEGETSIAKYNIPKTWTVKTPHGIHYYFKWTNQLASKVTTRTAILDGVDVRGDGGYVVHYGWQVSPLVVPLAQPPQWLIDLLPNKNESYRPIQQEEGKSEIKQSWLQQLLDELKEGNRNDTFTRIAGRLRLSGYSATDMFELLKPKAKEIDFPEQELYTICQSISRYEAKENISSNATSIESFLEEIEKVEWICEPIIARQTLGFVAGLPETNKTWMMIDLAVECAKGGGMWLKKFPVKAAKVLFIDQERFKGETQRRFKAVMAGKNISVADLRNALFVRCGTTTRLDLQVSYDAFRKEVSEIRPDLIIIDSFVSFHTSDENNRQAIQVVLERVKQIRNEFGCTFLFIDHENKGVFHDKEKDAKEQPSAMRMAGSVAKPAAAELVLTVRRQDAESSMVYHTKSTLASTTTPFMVRVIDQDKERTKINVEAY